MASTQGSCDDLSLGKKSGKGRRVWTEKEEEILILAMKEVVGQGWRSGNGFKAGYLNKVQAAFRKLFPGNDMRGIPHMNSKITAWKRSYYSLCGILNYSGVGFNLEGTFEVDADESQWETFIRNDSNAASIRGKRWPMYDDWKEIFGKDRANGEGAEDILEAVNEMEHEYATTHEDYIPRDYHVSLDEILSADKGENSFSQSPQPDEVPKNKGKKRKSSDGIETVCTLLKEISRNTNSRLETLANRIGYDYDVGKARKEVSEKLGAVPGLLKGEKYILCDILADKVERLEVFMGLPEDEKLEYLHHLLNDK